MNIRSLQKISKRFIDDKDWRKFQTAKELAINTSIEAIEANELVELFLWKDGERIDKSLKSHKDNELLKKIKNETADVFFSCLAIADHLDFDLGEAFLSKMEQLDKRYDKRKVKGKVVKIPEEDWLSRRK
ncbi:MAG: MazG-like family protein [Thermoplasmatales archaeon]